MKSTLNHIIYTVLCFTIVWQAPVLAADTFEVDPVHSAIVFKIKHLGITYVHGRFANPNGKLIVDSQNPGKSSVIISAKSKDINTDNPKRDKHLRSADFFQVERYPEIEFKSRSVKKIEDNVYEVTGDMSLHGVTKPLTVQVQHLGSGKDPWGGFRAGFETVFVINRNDFGITYGRETIADEVHITINIEAVRK